MKKKIRDFIVFCIVFVVMMTVFLWILSLIRHENFLNGTFLTKQTLTMLYAVPIAARLFVDVVIGVFQWLKEKK
ncbi:hypothetical protein FACS1894111_08090 [Clostridia bacterium]|nr:hypothetical protein FACS1894111_08090 [Clostridia bacterium]